MPRPNLFTDSAGRALVSKVRATKNIKADVEAAVRAIGGFPKLLKGIGNALVLIKPNIACGAGPPATTAPDILAATIELLQKHGAKKIVVGECSAISELPTRANAERLGLLEVCERLKVPFVPLEEGEYVDVPVKGKYYSSLPISKTALDAGRIVYLICAKTHYLARFSLSIKMTNGFTQPLRRVRWRPLRMETIHCEMNLPVGPDLIILDARTAFVAGGPFEGEVAEPELLLASGDRVALDVEGIKILQSHNREPRIRGDPWALPQLKYAVELGLGVRGPNDYVVVEK